MARNQELLRLDFGLLCVPRALQFGLVAFPGKVHHTGFLRLRILLLISRI